MSGFGDEGSLEMYRSRVQRSRKERVCCACNEPVRAGDLYQYTFGIWDGEPSKYVHCLRCYKILDVLCQRDQSPQMDLGCGHEWKEIFDEEPPEEIAALAFMTHEEIQAMVAVSQKGQP